MADAGRSWYTELDFDSYVLDLLLFGWCGLCFVIILAVNSIVAAFGPLQRQPQERCRGEVEGASLTGAVLPIETTKWFNDAVSWFYLHYYYTPDINAQWLNSLNDQLLKLGGPVQAKFERIQSGSLPPKVTHVSCEASPQDRFIVHARLETRDLSFVVFASQQTHEGVKLTNLTASVLRLKGTLRVQSYREGGDVKVSFNFEGKPEIKVLIKPLNPYQDTNELVDLGVVEANVRHSIILAKTTITVTHWLMPGNLNTVKRDFIDKGTGGGGGAATDDQSKAGANYQHNVQRQASGGSVHPAPTQTGGQQRQLRPQEQVEQAVIKENMVPMSSKVPSDENISVQKEIKQMTSLDPTNQVKAKDEQLKPVLNHDQQKRVVPLFQPQAVFQPVESAQNIWNFPNSSPLKQAEMVGDKRLLVKVIKANGLPLREVGAAKSVCMLSTDEPIQGYATCPVKNTQNPFWDEHFLFDITHDTQEVIVEVYDQGEHQDEFLGEAIVYVEDLRKTPSSRQILKLRSPEGKFENHSGTVTVEFLFMDPSEADLLLDSMTTTANNKLSPRRCTEIARAAARSVANQNQQNGYFDLNGLRLQQNNIKGRSAEDINNPYSLNETYSQRQPITLKA